MPILRYGALILSVERACPETIHRNDTQHRGAEVRIARRVQRAGRARASRMTRRLALGALTLGSASILFACLVGGRLAELVFAVLAVGFPALLMAVGAADRDGRLGSIAGPIGILLVVLEACLLGMIALVGEVESAAWLPLPAAATIQLVGLLLLPLGATALGYALTFDRFGVAEDDLERLRELAENGDGPRGGRGNEGMGGDL